MRILIVTPAPAGSRKGNRITAIRWARILRNLGHRVYIEQQYGGQNVDLIIALHARRSADSVLAFHDREPEKPLILALTGTDLYNDIHHNDKAMRSLEFATRLIVLQPAGLTEVPTRLQKKTLVVFQSVEPPRTLPAPLSSVFEVCVMGHLREVKDPFRTAKAARLLPSDSRIRVVHIGAALNQTMGRQPRREMQSNFRYTWLGELPRWKAIKRLARSRVLVLTSKMEGGANVISEAVTTNVPVIASRISGSLGLLGEAYPGFFPVGNTQALADTMYRAESDRAFYQLLQKKCRKLKSLFTPKRETLVWKQILMEFS